MNKKLSSELLCLNCKILINFQNKKDHFLHQTINQQEFMNQCKLLQQLKNSIRKSIMSILAKIIEDIENTQTQVCQKISNLMKGKFYFDGDRKPSLLSFKKIGDKLKNYFDNMLQQLKNEATCLQKLSIVMDNEISLKNFGFSPIFKHPLLRISKDSLKIKRQFIRRPGQTVYGLTKQPLTLINPKITFRINQQSQRYMYFGVCDANTFEKAKYCQSLYKMGNKMYAIRQNLTEGKKGITLHNSDYEYSNKEIVPWDFRIDDQISIKLIKKQKASIPWIEFLWNNALIFEMPLDNQTQQFYPFVGLKYNGDEVEIVLKQNHQV